MYTKQLEDLKYEVIFESQDELDKFNNLFFSKKYLKSGEVMKLLNISRSTLSHYVSKGLIKVEILPGGQYKYDYDSVVNLIK